MELEDCSTPAESFVPEEQQQEQSLVSSSSDNVEDSDLSLLLSLGANVVDREQFESDLVERLEQGLKDSNLNSCQLEDGECSNSSTSVQGLNDDDNVGDSDSRGQSSLSSNVVQRPEIVETDHERRVRLGEVTPFGSVLETQMPTVAKKDSFLNFGKYLQDQLALQKNKETSSSTKKKSVSENRKKASSSKSKKDVLNMNIMFPKKRKRKEPLGLGVSDDPRNARKKPSKSLAETTSTYLNYSEDSDYVPTDDDCSDEEPRSSKTPRKTVRKSKSGKNNLKEKDSDEDYSSEYDSDYERPSKRLRKETDDGDLKYYTARVSQWKETETRITGEFHTFEGGFKLPQHMWDELYKYQKVGVKWLWELHLQRSGGILGDEMGLGKTIQVINFLVGLACSNTLFRFSDHRGLGPVLLLCPATVMGQWVQEFHKWWPPFRVAILHDSGSYSGTKVGLIRSIVEGKGILITSYHGLVNNQNDILQHNWHYVILDEGHKIRNPDAQITIVAKQVKTPHRLILSGSPLQNNLKELWSLFDFVYPGKLGTLPTFMEQFSIPITQGGYSNANQVQVAVAYKCAKALREMINPYLLRRMKSDVQDHINLPPKNEQVLFCKLTKEQRDLYKSYIDSKEIYSIIKGNSNLFVGLINLRKICNHPHLFDGGPKVFKENPKYAKNTPKSKSGLTGETEEVDLEDEGDDLQLPADDAGFGHWSKSGKMVVVETLLKLWHAQGHKVLLFTQSRQMLCILENFVRQYKYSYLRLDGGTSISSRQPMINKFNEDPNIFIFILTTKVGGLGVNLTAANRVILYDPDWNPSTDIQARERAWRIGQSKEVTIYRLILSGTIEEKMYHRQVFKQFLTNRVLKDPKQKRFFKSNDMLELFQLNEGSKGTESEAIFAGTGSSVKVKKKKHRRKEKEAREKPSGKFKDVPNLVKQRSAKEQQEEEIEKNKKTNAEQDEYVLQKLFSKSGVHAALRHDKIVDTDDADYMIVEKEAECVAKRAVDALKMSREQCWSAVSGVANWTGTQGQVNTTSTTQNQQPKLRFGKKKPSTPAATTKSSSSSTVTSEEKFFSGQSLLQQALTGQNVSSSTAPVIPSSEILSIINNRKGFLGDDVGGSSSSAAAVGPELKQEQIDLLRDIREFIAFQAMVDGQATTDELVEKFGPRLPPGQSPLFKQMLKQLCSHRMVEGRGMWRLKPEFR